MCLWSNPEHHPRETLFNIRADCDWVLHVLPGLVTWVLSHICIFVKTSTQSHPPLSLISHRLLQTLQIKIINKMTQKKLFWSSYQVKMITTKHEINIKINYQGFISQISSCYKLSYHSRLAFRRLTTGNVLFPQVFSQCISPRDFLLIFRKYIYGLIMIVTWR